MTEDLSATSRDPSFGKQKKKNHKQKPLAENC